MRGRMEKERYKGKHGIIIIVVVRLQGRIDCNKISAKRGRLNDGTVKALRESRKTFLRKGIEDDSINNEKRKRKENNINERAT